MSIQAEVVDALEKLRANLHLMMSHRRSPIADREPSALTESQVEVRAKSMRKRCEFRRKTGEVRKFVTRSRKKPVSGLHDRMRSGVGTVTLKKTWKVSLNKLVFGRAGGGGGVGGQAQQRDLTGCALPRWTDCTVCHRRVGRGKRLVSLDGPVRCLSATQTPR